MIHILHSTSRLSISAVLSFVFNHFIMSKVYIITMSRVYRVFEVGVQHFACTEHGMQNGFLFRNSSRFHQPTQRSWLIWSLYANASRIGLDTGDSKDLIITQGFRIKLHSGLIAAPWSSNRTNPLCFKAQNLADWTREESTMTFKSKKASIKLNLRGDE